MRAYAAVLFGLALALGGCATIDTLEPGSGSTFEVRNRSFDQIWKAALTVVTRSLTIVEESRESGTIKAESRAGLATWGEVVAVFIRPPRRGERLYSVEVVSQKRSQVQVTGQNWEPGIVAGIKAELGL
jgi:hypothetical protein